MSGIKQILSDFVISVFIYVFFNGPDGSAMLRPCIGLSK
jgi:hypothetical protein